MHPQRRTKIIATLGPATDDPVVMDALIQAGLDVARVNFSHGGPETFERRVNMVRERAQAFGRTVGVLADLQGPKIRTGRFRDGRVQLPDGAPFTLDAALAEDAGDASAVGITYKNLPADVARGDTLLLDDGAIVLWVEAVEGAAIRTRVVVGGELSNNKGINRQGGGLSAGALTDKDRADIVTAARLQADYLALSFPRTAADVREARELLRATGGTADIVSKIERAEAMQNIDEIIAASDAVMIARGDLGVEIGDAELPGVQKLIITKARRANCVVITATQMMQSMIESPLPTRAEVMDVANAVLDGTDAVMLSAETAVGVHPHKVVAAMDRICRGAEKQRAARESHHRMDQAFSRADEAIAMAAMYTANHLDVAAIIALTESGSTTRWMSRISSGIPIFALSPRLDTRRKLTLLRGVYPVSFESASTDHALVNIEAVDELKRRGALRDGDLVIITKGDLSGVSGGTNALKIARAGQMFHPAGQKTDS